MKKSKNKNKPQKRKIAKVISGKIIRSFLIAFIICTIFMVSYMFIYDYARAGDYNLTMAKDLDNQVNEIAKIYVDNRMHDLFIDTTIYDCNSNDLSEEDRDLYCKLLSDRIGDNKITMNIIDKNGIISVSSDSSLVGRDIRSEDESDLILSLYDEDSENFHSDTVSFEPTERYGLEPLCWMQIYLGYQLNDDYEYDDQIIEFGISDEIMNTFIYLGSMDSATYRRVGKTGFQFLTELGDENGTLYIFSSTDKKYNDLTVSDIGITVDPMQIKDGIYEKMYCIVDGAPSLVSAVCHRDDFFTFSVYPLKEVFYDTGRNVVVLLMITAILLYVIYIVLMLQLRSNVMDNIKEVNNSLEMITNGDLEEKVNVYDTLDFELLSTNINITVDKLKNLINEAENRINEELEYAKAIQRSSLPSNFSLFDNIPGVDLFADMITAKEVGGDLYDFFLMNDNRLFFYVADVSGKGIPAAMFMMRTKSALQANAESVNNLSEIMRLTNEMLSTDNDEDMFVTAWVCALDFKTGILSYVNAGHNPPVLIDSKKAEFISSKPALVLGFMEGTSYETHSIHLSPGAKLFLYTDGVTEARNIDGGFYGEERLLHTLSNICSENAREQDTEPGSDSPHTPRSIITELLTDVKEFSGEADQADDITVLCLKYEG